MGYNNTPLMIPVAFFALLLLSTGCSSPFSHKLEQSIEVCECALNDSRESVIEYWRSDQRLSLLKASASAIKSTGVIDHAVLSVMNKEEHMSLWIGYLSNDANVKEIVVLAGDHVIFSVPPPLRNYAKRFESHSVAFNEILVWRTADNPFQGLRAGDLSVKLIKDDGSVIGPARMLSDKDVWEIIRVKMLADEKWQKKFPWLYARLQKDPAMGPMWRDPDIPPPAIGAGVPAAR